MKKAIITFILACSLLAGCIHDKTAGNDVPESDLIGSKTNTVFQIQFNEERYIWESFLFPTNRTTGR